MSLLTHYDDARTAIINPEDLITKLENFPKIAIATFTDRVLEVAFKDQEAEIITYLHGDTLPVYKLNFQGIEIALIVSKTGAAISVVGAESLIALGAEELIYYGSCGALDHTIDAHSIVIPTHAIRDEGTSYHYLKASDEIELDCENIRLLTQLLEDLEQPYHIGKTWTTDAIFRETRKKFEQRKEQGSIVVEMECSALAAVAQFRGVSFTQFLYAADNLDADQWDPRILGKKVSKDELYLLIALEYAMTLTKRRMKHQKSQKADAKE